MPESRSGTVSGLGLQFIKKETLVQAFFCEICEIFKNTFFYRTPPVAASGSSLKKMFKKRLRHRCFLVNVAIFLKTSLLKTASATSKY